MTRPDGPDFFTIHRVRQNPIGFLRESNRRKIGSCDNMFGIKDYVCTFVSRMFKQLNVNNSGHFSRITSVVKNDSGYAYEIGLFSFNILEHPLFESASGASFVKFKREV